MSTITYEELFRAAEIGETTDWEFKAALGGFPGSFWDTYSAMANTDGGIVVLGAHESKDTIRLDGLTQDQINRYKKQLWDDVNNRSTVSVNLLDNNHIKEVPVAGGILLCITVPAAGRRQRPVYRGQSPFGNTYRRNHEGDYRCSDDEVKRMFADADPDNTPDMRILEGFSIADLDAASLTQYRQRFRSVKGDPPWLSLDDKQLLENLSGWRKDRKSGQEGLTVAGLIMFGKYNAITDPDGVPDYFVDYREKVDPAIRWSDRIYPDGTWEANLFQFYQRVWPKIASGLPVPFQLEQGVRRDETPAHEALREAFINALIHADYRVSGSVIVIRFPNRFIFDNPGILLVSLEQYRRGGISECRNKALQKMFSMIGGGERAGSGVDKIRTGWNSRQWRTPWISLNTNPNRVQLSLPMTSLIPDEVLAELKKEFGNALGHLTPDEIQALATARIEGGVSNARLQELISKHPVDISRMLQKLCETKFLISDNKKRWATYRLSGQEESLSLFNQLNIELDGTLTQTGSGNLPDNSIHTGMDSSLSARDSSLSARDSSLSARDSSLSARDSSLSAPLKKRLPPEEMIKIILTICRDKYLTYSEIAEKVGRNPRSLRNQYLTPMVRRGQLWLKYPSSPNRTDQAYTTAEKSE
jgi:ATP-dependent DNA helicase RecG